MIYIAGDKHGFSVVSHVEEYLKLHALPYENLGVTNDDSDVKLEKLIPPVIKRVLEDEMNMAILSCGTGVGVEVGSNKFSGIRACLATNEMVARWSREYDKCNILCLVGWKTTKEQIFKILDAWFGASYDGDTERLAMFKAFDTWH